MYRLVNQKNKPPIRPQSQINKSVNLLGSKNSFYKINNIQTNPLLSHINFEDAIDLYEDIFLKRGGVKTKQSRDDYKISHKLKNNVFNIKGYLISTNIDSKEEDTELTKLSSNHYTYSFNLDILSNEDTPFTLRLSGISFDLLLTINDYVDQKKKPYFYFTNLCGFLDEENKKKIGIYFTNTILTKIYYEANPILIGRSNLSSKRTAFSQGSKISQGRIDSDSLIDLVPFGYLDYITHIDLNTLIVLINKIPKEYLNYDPYLHFKVFKDIFDLKLKVEESLIRGNKLISLYGLIIDVNKKRNSYGNIEIESLIDPNKITVTVINKPHLLLGLKPGMIVYFKNYKWETNFHYDFDIVSRHESKNEILGYISNERINQFRKSKDKRNILNFTSLISLISNLEIERRQCKFLFNITKIFRVDAEYLNDYKEINNYDGLSLKGVFKVQDGSFQCIAHIIDNGIIEIFGMTEKELNKISENAFNKKYFPLFRRDTPENTSLNKNNFFNAFSKQFIMYGYPIAKTYANTSGANGMYYDYFNKISYTSNKEISRDKLSFINGYAEVEQNPNKKGKVFVTKIPMVKINRVDSVE